MIELNFVFIDDKIFNPQNDLINSQILSVV